MAKDFDTPFVDGKIKGMSGGASKSMGKKVGKKAAKMTMGKGPKK